MSDDHHQAEPGSGIPLNVEVRSDTPVGELISYAILAHQRGIGNAVDTRKNTIINGESYHVHIHVCVTPTGTPVRH